MKYKFTYKQEFMGKILTDSIIKTVESQKDVLQTERDIATDPHVFWVESEEVTE